MKRSTTDILKSNLKSLMDAGGLSNRRLGEKSGVSARMVGKILNGESVPTVDVLEKIAAAFGMETWQLLHPILSDKKLAQESMAIIELYSSADPDGKRMIRLIAERESGRSDDLVPPPPEISK